MLEVEGMGSAYMRIAFRVPASWDWSAPHTSHGIQEEVYLFLRNEMGENEESFLFRVHYVGVTDATASA